MPHQTREETHVEPENGQEDYSFLKPTVFGFHGFHVSNRVHLAL